MRKSIVALVLICALAVSACGHKAPPKPPADKPADKTTDKSTGKATAPDATTDKNSPVK